MKRTIGFIILALVTLCSVFAGSRELKLTYTEKAYTNFDFLYGGSLLTEEGKNEKTVVLTEGESEPITVRWNYNIGPITNLNTGVGIMIHLSSEGFKHTSPEVNDTVDVFMNVNVNDSCSSLYSNPINVIDSSKDYKNNAVISIYPNTNIRGTADVADITITWDKDHSWIAGEYRCDIRIDFYAE